MGKYDYIIEEMLREDDGITIDEAYHRTRAEQKRADEGGGIVDGYPFIGKEDSIEILNRLLKKGKIVDETPSDRSNLPRNFRTHRQTYGSNPPKFNSDIVEYAVKHPEESEIFGDKRFRNRIFTPRQHQLAYGRNEKEVHLDNACFDWIIKKGKAFGLDVDADMGNANENMFDDPESLDYASFIDLNAIINLFKAVSAIFRDRPGHRIIIPPKKEMEFDNGEKYMGADKEFCTSYIENELRRAFAKNGGRMKLPWSGNVINGIEIDPKYNNADFSEALYMAKSIVRDIFFDHHESDEYGMIFGGRIVTQQQDADEEIEHSMKQDINAFAEYTKQDGYHAGIHWTSDGYGWVDPGESWPGMGYIKFQGSIPISSVNWERTVATHMQFPNEKELWLYPGRPILNPVCSYCSERICIYMRPMDKGKCLIA